MKSCFIVKKEVAPQAERRRNGKIGTIFSNVPLITSFKVGLHGGKTVKIVKISFMIVKNYPVE